MYEIVGERECMSPERLRVLKKSERRCGEMSRRLKIGLYAIAAVAAALAVSGTLAALYWCN